MNKELVANTIMPKQIGRYLITNELAKGGMATIYTGVDPRFEREVAIKVLPHALLHDPTFRTRFVREAKTVAALEHPFIVPVHDYGEEDNQPYIVMRLMRGGSLADKISAGPLPKSEIETIMNRVNQALEVAHKKGIIHRDLKPGNILFDQYGNAFLSDFGIAHITNTQSNLTNTGGAVGTPGYMSPEQIQGRPVDGRSDIYALGILLFEMLTGQKPFVADTPAMMIVKQMTESVPNICDLDPNLPPVYDELIRRLTANDREDRPPQATYVTKMIQAVHNVNSTKETDTAVSPKPPLPAPKTKPITPRIVPKPASRPEIPPPILPLITPEPEPIQTEPVHPVNDEIPSKIFLPCPHCRGTIVTNDEHNGITCPHCHRQIALTGHLCPYCNTFHEEESSFCDNCGAALTRLCTTCNTVNWSGVERCENCNTSLDIFENIRQHDKRIVMESRQARQAEIKAYKQREQEASQRRMKTLRGDVAGKRRLARRHKILRQIFIILIVALLSGLAYFIYISMFAGG